MSDVERLLLSKMTQVDHIRKVTEIGLRAEVFEDPYHKLMFDFMVDYFQKAEMAQAPTWIVMEAEYPSIPLQHEVEETVEWCADWLQKRFKRNRVQSIAMDAAHLMEDDPDGALRTMWQQAYAAAAVVAPRNTKSDMSTNVQARRERYNHDRDNADLMGVSFGLAELDEHTRGIRAGELAAVAARTKVGKSWLLANAFVSNHKTGKQPILFTLEMDIEEMEDRIDCLYSGVSYSAFTKRELSVDDIISLEAARKELDDAGCAILARPGRGDRTVKTMLTEARQQGSDLILVDQLSWIDAEHHYTGDSATRMKHGELIADLKDDGSSASAGKLAMFVAIQLNRETMRRDAAGNGRGALENFANSDMIGQTVDIALGLWRNQDMRNSNLMGLDIMGTRRCDAKSWLLNWHLNSRTEIRIAEEYNEVQG